MQLDRLARVGDGVLNRAARGRAAQDVRYGHPVEVRIVGLFNLDPETKTARANSRLTS